MRESEGKRPDAKGRARRNALGSAVHIIGRISTPLFPSSLKLPPFRAKKNAGRCMTREKHQ